MSCQRDWNELIFSINNAVPQGLSSSLFTSSLQAMGKWLGPEGSDCGLVNVRLSRLFPPSSTVLMSDQHGYIGRRDRRGIRRVSLSDSQKITKLTRRNKSTVSCARLWWEPS